jgi:hypothetical protein
MTLAPTDLKEVEQLIAGKPASAAYPVNLPLPILKQISRDLRECEIAMKNGVETGSFAAPLLLIIHIVSNTDTPIKKSSSLNFDEKKAYLWLRKYTYYSERELIGRIVGKTIDNTNEMVEQLISDI